MRMGVVLLEVRGKSGSLLRNKGKLVGGDVLERKGNGEWERRKGGMEKKGGRKGEMKEERVKETRIRGKRAARSVWFGGGGWYKTLQK